jgi:prepilin-type N-terminal cleavage/methylation domain-containing protein
MIEAVGLGSRPPASAGRGFTLTELLVVVAIIGTLASLLLPSLDAARTLTLRTRCAGNLRHLHLAMNEYVNANAGRYPCAKDPVSASPSLWLWMGRGWRPFIAPYLGQTLDPSRASALFCEGDPAREGYEATSYAYSMTFYHSPEQIDAMSKPADTYSSPKPSVAQSPYQVADPERKILVGEWTANHPRPRGEDKGWWCWEGSRSYLFANGTVRYLQARQIRPARDDLPDCNLTVGGIAGRDR